MKTRLVGMAAGLLLATPAVAADMPVKASVAAPVVATWSGCYIGVNGGYGWGRETRSSSDPDEFWSFPIPASDTMHMSGGAVGGQAGCNWQAAPNWVFGVEISGDASRIRQRKESVFYNPSNLNDDYWETNISSVFALTGRIGYAAGDLLPYLKSGLAGVQMRSRFDDILRDRSVEENTWYMGGLLGAGVEYRLAPSWTVGVEYSHIWLAGQSFASARFQSSTGIPTGSIDTWSNRTGVDMVMGRVNYYFGH